MELVEKLKRVITAKYDSHDLPKQFANGETLTETIEKAIANVNELGSGGGGALKWRVQFEDDIPLYSEGTSEFSFEDCSLSTSNGIIYRIEVECEGYHEVSGDWCTLWFISDFMGNFDVDNKLTIYFINLNSGDAEYNIDKFFIVGNTYEHNIHLRISALAYNGHKIDALTLGTFEDEE